MEVFPDPGAPMIAMLRVRHDQHDSKTFLIVLNTFPKVLKMFLIDLGADGCLRKGLGLVAPFRYNFSYVAIL